MEKQPELSNITPVLLAAVVCDTACRDPNSGKISLIGIFDRLVVVQFPTSRAASVYLKITDAIGNYHFAIKFVQTNTGKIIAEVNGDLNIKDKLGSSELWVSFPPLPVENSGRYEFQIWTNEMFLGSTFIDAETRDEAKKRRREEAG